jgi:APA family basic amino acid/polyamine antiporter
VYYAVANASARTLPHASSLARAVAALGLLGCLVLTASLPIASLLAGAGVLAIGVAIHLLRRARYSGAPLETR